MVKGGNYTRDQLPEAQLVERLGGVVQILPYVLDRSTTGIIERIKAGETWTDGVPGRDAGRYGLEQGEAEGDPDDGLGVGPRHQPALY